MALVVVAVAAAVVPVKGTRNERAHKKKGGCALGAAALYRRRPQSTFAGAVCLHDGGNGTQFCNEVMKFPKIWGRKKNTTPPQTHRPPKINKKSAKFVTRLQNFVNENIGIMNKIKGPCKIFLVYLEGALNHIKTST
jgi:hypothetical protein